MIGQRISASTMAAAICLLGFIGCAWGQGPSPRGEVGWVGLYTDALVEWLENANRLSQLCPDAIAGTQQWQACRAEKLAPMQHVIEVRATPQANAVSRGAIVVVAVPGEGLSVSYRPALGQSGEDFSPDLLDADWGYGPYFHQTFLERRGTWFLLPGDPLPQPAWINAAWLGEEPHVRLLQAGDLIRAPRSDLFVLEVNEAVLRARPEQEADMWCAEGEPPPLRPANEIVIPLQELYSRTGHLLVGIKYTRGC